MASKYDTNPLDPEFPEKAKAAAAAGDVLETQMLQNDGARTRQFASAPTEEQTRRFVGNDAVGYESPYNGQFVPANYAAADHGELNRSSSRRVEKVGLPENILTALPYIPWYIGMIAGLLILFFIPKSEAKVRFHAAQGLAAHVAILAISMVLGVVGNVSDIADIGNFIFNLVTSIMLIVFAVKAWKGKPVHIASVDDLTNWLEEKIAPKG